MKELAEAATAVRGKLDDLQVKIAALVKASPFEKPQRAVAVATTMLALLEVQSRVGELLVAEIRELRAAAHGTPDDTCPDCGGSMDRIGGPPCVDQGGVIFQRKTDGT